MVGGPAMTRMLPDEVGESIGPQRGLIIRPFWIGRLVMV
jgi:hypothetical protein